MTPTYNEAANIEPLVDALEQARRDTPFDVLIVDDSSPDGTAEAVHRLRRGRPWLRVLVRPQRAGLGSAYRHGFRWALAQGYGFVGEMDADLSHDPGDVPRLWRAAADGAALALGSRYVRGGRTVGWPLRRKALSRAANVYARTLLGLRARDVTSGFRVYRRDAVEHLLETHCEGYGFQVEGIYTVSRNGWRIAELPITFRERESGVSKMSRAVAIEAARRCLQLARERLVLRRSRPPSCHSPHPSRDRAPSSLAS